jgi:hypothetical protein
VVGDEFALGSEPLFTIDLGLERGRGLVREHVGTQLGGMPTLGRKAAEMAETSSVPHLRHPILVLLACNIRAIAFNKRAIQTVPCVLLCHPTLC